MLDESAIADLSRQHFGLDLVAEPKPMHSGNINHSARLPTSEGDFVLQQLNRSVFTDAAALMKNAELIIDRLRDHNIATLEYRDTVDGHSLAEIDGVIWRCYHFVDGSATSSITTVEDAQATARAFGRYAAAISDLSLIEHLPGYHDFDARVAEFDTAVASDDAGRRSACEATVERAVHAVDRLRLSPSFDAWREAPTRNAHNDAKAPNCVIAAGGRRTIIDLDTTMPGTILSDVGELVRSSTRGLVGGGPQVIMAQIEAVNRGFFGGFGDEMTDVERNGILVAGPLMTTENALRFLADHLNGDTYYGAETEGENLEKAQAQLTLAGEQIAAIEHAVTG
ncbi:MAG: aminoglycoside phosphotransferase family protein [Acidimicrobiales bacterium]|nr:aminoglycoside phosphotransferase family protein [Acidimicrobiales bacterium]